MTQQQQPYGCGVYAVANSLMIPDYIKIERIEQSKNGNSIYQLNDWLQEDGVNFRVETLYFNMSNIDGAKIIDAVFDIESKEKDENVYCVLLQVKLNKQSKWHLVAARLKSNGELLITDSLKEKPINCTMNTINEHYYQVSGLFFFETVGNAKEKAVIIYPEMEAHS